MLIRAENRRSMREEKTVDVGKLDKVWLETNRETKTSALSSGSTNKITRGIIGRREIGRAVIILIHQLNFFSKQSQFSFSLVLTSSLIPFFFLSFSLLLSRSPRECTWMTSSQLWNVSEALDFVWRTRWKMPAYGNTHSIVYSCYHFQNYIALQSEHILLEWCPNS